MKNRILVAMALLTLGAGCRTADQRAHASATPRLVHTAPTERQFQDRTAELERAGHSKATAERKARTEFSKDAWRHDTSESWAAERKRAERVAARERMEKDLSQLDERP